MVVVAAGSGERFGGPKQFAELHGRPLVAWSMAAARTVADGVVLVLPAGGVPADADAALPPAEAIVPGGTTRSDSVRAGLAAVPDSASVVVVHDAARPLATPALFAEVVRAVGAVDGPSGAIPGVPVADTVKQVAAGRVVATLPRHDLVAVQTPQAFRADALRRAHRTGGSATDDAALVEALGLEVRVVPGEPWNIKVTTPGDLQAAAVLRPAP